jgi:hypothetical protein
MMNSMRLRGPLALRRDVRRDDDAGSALPWGWDARADPPGDLITFIFYVYGFDYRPGTPRGARAWHRCAASFSQRTDGGVASNDRWIAEGIARGLLEELGEAPDDPGPASYVIAYALDDQGRPAGEFRWKGYHTTSGTKVVRSDFFGAGSRPNWDFEPVVRRAGEPGVLETLGQVANLPPASAQPLSNVSVIPQPRDIALVRLAGPGETILPLAGGLGDAGFAWHPIAMPPGVTVVGTEYRKPSGPVGPVIPGDDYSSGIRVRVAAPGTFLVGFQYNQSFNQNPPRQVRWFQIVAGNGVLSTVQPDAGTPSSLPLMLRRDDDAGDATLAEGQPEALITLLRQIDAAWPGRRRGASDGLLVDAGDSRVTLRITLDKRIPYVTQLLAAVRADPRADTENTKILQPGAFNSVDVPYLKVAVWPGTGANDPSAWDLSGPAIGSPLRWSPEEIRAFDGLREVHAQAQPDAGAPTASAGSAGDAGCSDAGDAAATDPFLDAGTLPAPDGAFDGASIISMWDHVTQLWKPLARMKPGKGGVLLARDATNLYLEIAVARTQGVAWGQVVTRYPFPGVYYAVQPGPGVPPTWRWFPVDRVPTWPDFVATLPDVPPQKRGGYPADLAVFDSGPVVSIWDRSGQRWEAVAQTTRREGLPEDIAKIGLQQLATPGRAQVVESDGGGTTYVVAEPGRAPRSAWFPGGTTPTWSGLLPEARGGSTDS